MKEWAVKKFLFSAAFAAVAMTASVGAKADGITLCFASAVNNVSIIPTIGFVESAVVINNASGTPILKADSQYGSSSTVGSYWTSAYPANITLPTGCSTIYFMVKNTPPSTGTQWMCAQPAIGNGPTNAAGTAFATVVGSIGGGAQSGVMQIPAIPNAAPATVSGCPQGY
jgi:hypothetical protein